MSGIIDIIAPGGKIRIPSDIVRVKNILNSWGYTARLGKNLLGSHDFLSHTDLCRFEDLKNALYAKDSQIIWCYRGGSGCAELLPLLDQLSAPKQQKIFLGFSDITSLHLFFNQKWHWATFHGPNAGQLIDEKLDDFSVHQIKALFKNIDQNINYLATNPAPALDLISFNSISKNISAVSGCITGGNLSVVCHSLGTAYQIITANKTLLLEDINEPAYKIRRMLVQLEQANIFKYIKALILGNFTQQNQSDNFNNIIEQELKLFAEKQPFPIFRTNLAGHTEKNSLVLFNREINLKIKK